MMFWYENHWALWQVGLGWLVMLAFLSLVIWAVYALVTSATKRPDSDHREGDALLVLDRRLAKGESRSMSIGTCGTSSLIRET